MTFNPMEDPTQCPMCNNHPSWEEVADGLYECRNCGAHINSEGNIVREPEDVEDDGDDLWDE